MQDEGGWRRSATRKLYESPWFDVRQDEVTLPNGDEITYTMVDHPGYAMVVPLLDDGRVVMERIYRYTVSDTLLECPAGGIEDESPEAAARRELEEETGWRAGEMRSLGAFFGSSGISNERCHYFLATGLEERGQVRHEATEQIEIELLPFERAVAMALSGEVRDAPSALALILADHHLRALADGA